MKLDLSARHAKQDDPGRDLYITGVADSITQLLRLLSVNEMKFVLHFVNQWIVDHEKGLKRND